MLKLDLHVHSCHSSDGWTTPRQIVNMAEQRNLDGISITDHNYFDPGLIDSLRNQTDLAVIPGSEISSKIGHILAYFINEPVEPWRAPEEIIRDIHDQNGLAVMAHPYRMFFHYPEGYIESFDAIEAFNGRSQCSETNDTPNNRTTKLLETMDVAETAGSDSHLPWTVGNGYLEVESSQELQAIREAILSGKAKPKGVASLQLNRAISQFIRLCKEPNFLETIKYPLKSLNYLKNDLIQFFNEA